MYKLEYLPIARQDMIDNVKYISKELNNPTAANKLASEMTEAADKRIDYPYTNNIHATIKPLKYEYRKQLVTNYIMFYWINEQDKVITIARVIYARRNYEKLL